MYWKLNTAADKQELFRRIEIKGLKLSRLIRSRPPEDTTMAEIYELVEGTLKIVDLKSTKGKEQKYLTNRKSDPFIDIECVYFKRVHPIDKKLLVDKLVELGFIDEHNRKYIPHYGDNTPMIYAVTKGMLTGCRTSQSTTEVNTIKARRIKVDVNNLIGKKEPKIRPHKHRTYLYPKSKVYVLLSNSQRVRIVEAYNWNSTGRPMELSDLEMEGKETVFGAYQFMQTIVPLLGPIGLDIRRLNIYITN